MGVIISWFNDNPKHTRINIENMEKADTENIYVGEKVWAKYAPDGLQYEAKIDTITVTWFNNNPEHRVLKRKGISKMTELDFEERFEDAETREKEEKQESKALSQDLDVDVKTLVEQEYGIKM